MSDQADDRLKSNGGAIERTKKASDPARADRAMNDRPVTENREMTDEERLEMFRGKFSQDVLPDLPPIPGYHLIWLTTSNPRDSIAMRLRLGYEPVKSSDMPGWEHVSIKTGEYAGFIGVNELIAFKLPLSLYHKYMQENHHDAPLREEGKLTETAEFLKKQLESQGAKLVEGDGNKEIREYVPAPASWGS